MEQILISTVGGAADVKPKSEKAICGCSDLNHGQIRKAIREHRLTSLDAAMRFMDWKTPNGCATCRPALNYYLISTWPGEAKDDPQSRLINERAHANIQKDGTYSVVPRMWGGVTNAAELRRIADVADKYQVPMVKVTGGQRIDLLGVKKDDLPAIWKDLDMPSGHAYGKSIRTVKTCVGSEFCRFGTQNSTQLGIDLEHDLFNMWSPHKVKLAVSGCPRNCAEAGIKDVGIIGVDSGWEMYIGGNGGIKTEVAEFFVKLKTAEEVREYNGAFLQALPRGSLLPGAHGALPAAGRHGAHPQGGGRGRGKPQGAQRPPAIRPVLRAGPMEAAHRTAAIEEGVRTDSAQATGKRLNPLSGPSHGGPPLPE